MDVVETKSFIPKSTFAKPGTRTFYKEAGFGIVFKLAAALLFIALAVFGGAFWYKGELQKQIDSLSPSLERAKAAFDPAFINDAEDLVKRIGVAKKLLENHRFPTGILDLLENLTVDELRFTQFSYTTKLKKTEEGEDFSVLLGLAGEAKSYKSLAQQSEVFKNSPYVELASFSNFSLTQTGTVSFSLDLDLVQSILLYD